MKRTHFLCCVLLLMSLSGIQAETLVVEIANPADDLLPNILVTVQGNQITQQDTTNTNGRCRFYALPPGEYNVIYHYKNQPISHRDIFVAPDAITELILTTQSQHHKTNYLRTGTAHDLTLSKLHKVPIHNATDWAITQTGISQHQNQLHVRGGRAEDLRIYIDGLPEPINHRGHTFTHVTTTNATHITVAKSGFNAQYGQTMSGIIHVVTPHHQRTLFGNLEGTTDHPSGYGQNRLAATLGSSLFDHKATAKITANWQHDTDTDPRHSVGPNENEQDLLPTSDYLLLSNGQLPHNGQRLQTLRGYLKVRLSDHITMQTRFTHSKQERQYYEHSYRYNLRHAPEIHNRAQSLMTQLNWRKQKTHITARIKQTTYKDQQGDGTHFDNLLAYGRPTGNPGFDIYQLFWNGDQTGTPIETTADGFSLQDEGHVYNEFLKQHIQTRTPLDIHLTTQLSPNHTLQAGFQLNLHTLRTYQHLTPTFISRANQSVTNVIKYGYDWDPQTQSIHTSKDAKNPADAALYLHSKTEFKGFLLDIGMRFDYFSARAQFPISDIDPFAGDFTLEQDERTRSRSDLSLSPRVGLKAQITSATAFHAHFGVLRQVPTYSNLFSDLNYFEKRVSRLRTTYAFGNPNLAQSRTSAFEMGLSHQTSSNTHLDATVYIKRAVELPQRITLLAQPTHYDTYRNTNVATLRGVEVTAHFQPEPFLAFQAAYGYAHHTGTGISDYPEIDLAPGFPAYLGDPSTQSTPLSSERRHTFITQLNLNFPASFWAYGLARTSTGRAYTPTDPVSVQLGFLNTLPNSGALQSARTSGFFQMDLKAGKTFEIGRFKTDLFVSATNLSNHANPRAVYPSTGNPQASGWLTTEEGRKYLDEYGDEGRTQYLIKEQNPLNNGVPRQIHFGTLIRF